MSNNSSTFQHQSAILTETTKTQEHKSNIPIQVWTALSPSKY
jgi:hypothetical protein